MTAAAPREIISPTLTQLLKAAADDLRLNILKALATDSYGVMELAQAFEIKQSGMSHHLKLLSSAGLISSRREGNSIFYRRAVIGPADALLKVKKALFYQVDQQTTPTWLQHNLESLWAQRAQTSERFFVDNADKFADQQDLIANFEVYQQQVTELLKLDTSGRQQRALEIGPGQGEFLSTLGARYEQVLALDSSQEMLSKARKHCAEQALNNVEFVHGDTAQLAKFPEQFDTAVANMVLHHTPSPSLFIKHCSQALRTGGAFLISELCSHNQSWATQACGDIWLGFNPEELTQWAQEAGFELGQSVYFALRNGFQIQVHQFLKN